MEITNHSSNKSLEDPDLVEYNNTTSSFVMTDDELSVTEWVALFQYSLVIVVGVPGNGLVVWITTFKMKRSVNTLWFQHLAVADLLCCLTVPFTIMHIVLQNYSLGLFTCKFISFLLLMNMYASVHLLTMISIDRCLLVMRPVWCQNKRTLRKAYVTCAIMWILAAILSSPALIFRNIWNYNGKKICSYDYSWFGHHRQMVGKSIALCRLLIGFLIPLLIIIVCYTLLMYRVKLRFIHHTKTMKVAIAVIIGFFVCCFPYHVSRIILVMEDPGSPLFTSTVNLLYIFRALAFMNSCINPIIYVLMSEGLRSKMKKSLNVIIKNVLEEETAHSGCNLTNLTSETKIIELSMYSR